MASIKDAVEDAFQESSSIIKYVIYAIPLFLVIHYAGAEVWGYNFWAILTGLLLFGFMLTCTYNVRKGNNVVLPSFNVFAVLWRGLKGVLALAPIATIAYFASIFIAKLITQYIADESIAGVACNIVYCIFASLTFTSYLLYSHRFKILDAYNVKTLSKYCIDILLAFGFMLVLLALVDVIIVTPVTYVIWLFMGIPNPVAIFFWCVVAVLNLAIAGDYLAQISYEKIEVKENEEADAKEAEQAKIN